ncbi:MAG: acyltransferase family protein [Actinomycetes bacterium]
MTEADASAGGGVSSPTRFVSAAPKLGFAAPLDGLRAVAILLVLLAHSSYEGFGSFVGGVDVFFVVSGFLITTLLLDEDREYGSVGLRAFYIRRALRLLPLLLLVLAATLGGAVVLHLADVGDPDFLATTWSDVWPGALYISHVVHPVHQEVLVGGAPLERPLIQLWSLSVEEHFYVFGVLGILVFIGRKWMTTLALLLLGAWLFVGTARALGHVGPNLAWWQRPDSIFLGVLLAVANAHLSPERLTERVRTWLGRAAVVAAVVGGWVLFVGTAFAKPLGLYLPFSPEPGGDLRDSLYWGRLGFSVVALCSAVVVLAVVRLPDSRLARGLSVRPLRAVGRRSYAIYLIHVPLYLLMREALGNKLGDGPVLLLYLPALVVSVELAHRYVERPLGRLRHRYAPGGASATPV